MLLVVALGQQRASTVETTLAAFVLHHVAFCLCGAYRAALRRGACEAVCSPEASSVFGALRWDTRSILSCTLLSPLSISRSNPSPITPAVLPPTHYLQLPAPASISCGSQQPRLCNQGVYRSNTAVDEVELLTDAGTWLKVQSTRVMVSSSEQVRAAPVCAAPDFRTLSTHSAVCIYPCLCTLPLQLASALRKYLHPHLRTLPFPTYCPHERSLR